ncbi:unnamed protein product [Dicrocoelium dendriticum]|nr:unnamed protein product [Dicrocoelium dendriticum]CAH8583843.1 unnamed protein product [Dicrocoelium dendriticum]
MESCTLSPNCRFKSANEGVIVEWKSPPKSILVVHKFCDDTVIERLKELVKFILQTWNVTVFLEPETVLLLQNDTRFRTILGRYASHVPVDDDDDRLTSPSPTDSLSDAGCEYNGTVQMFAGPLANDIDLVVCLGGDGTLLKIGSIFQGCVPPVLPFHLGTFGFLTPLPFKSYRRSLRYAIDGSPQCLMRARLCCQILRAVSDDDKRNGTPGSDSSSGNGTPDKEYHFLNELVVDRGLSPCPCDLIVKVNGRVVTHFEGDGLIVSTPTGSTAYSMATGASMLHPCVPAFLLTPINSLTLSSRAIVLPTSLCMEICINPTARCKVAHFSFDGRSRASNLIRDGDSILIKSSSYPMPCLSGTDQEVDWFSGLHCLLNWNSRSKYDLLLETDSVIPRENS